MIRPLLLPLLLLQPSCAPPEGASVSRAVHALGTQVTIQVSAADRESALAASEGILEALERAEARLSTWREDTELAALNRSANGDPVQPSALLTAELERTFALRDSTEGAFDPAIGPLVKAWSLRTQPAAPTSTILTEALEAVRSGFEWNAEERSVSRSHEHAALEEGAWGKGAALDAALATLRTQPEVTAFVDLGGQYGFVRAAGSIAVADPRGRELPAVASIAFEGRGSVATTGNSERGKTTGHILDPRTGLPAEDFGSVTVWAEDGLTADALSTALFVLGPNRALDFAEAEPGVEALVIVLTPPNQPGGGSLRLRATSGLRERLRIHPPHLPAEFQDPQ